MMPKKLSKDFQPFLKNSFYLYLSHFADYFILLLFLPFISRILGAEEFGRISLSQTFSIFIILLIEFGNPLYAARKVAKIKQDNEKLRLFIGQLFTSKILLIPILTLLGFICVFFIPIFNENPHYIIIVILGAFFQGISPTWFFQGIESMKKIAVSKIFFRLFGFLTMLYFVKSSNDGWIVLFIYSLISFLICMYLLFEMLKITGSFSLSNIDEVKNIYHKSRNSFFITIFPIVYQNISMLVLSIYVGPYQLGIYYGANRIYRAFNSLYSPLGQAFFPRITATNSINAISAYKLLKSFFLLITFIGISFYLIILFFSDQIILILLGENFSSSKNVLIIFGGVLPLTAVSHALGRQWLMVKNKDSIYAFCQFISSLIGFLCFVLTVKKLGIISFPISLLFFESSSILLILFILLFKIK